MGINKLEISKFSGYKDFTDFKQKTGLSGQEAIVFFLDEIEKMEKKSKTPKPNKGEYFNEDGK